MSTNDPKFIQKSKIKKDKWTIERKMTNYVFLRNT